MSKANRVLTRVVKAPCQHSCARGLFDLDKCLWASWGIQSLTDSEEVGASVRQGTIPPDPRLIDVGLVRGRYR